MPDKTPLKLSQETTGLEVPRDSFGHEVNPDPTDMIGLLFEESEPSVKVEDTILRKDTVPVENFPQEIQVHTEDVPAVDISVDVSSEPENESTVEEIADTALKNINSPDSEKFLSNLARARIASNKQSQVG